METVSDVDQESGFLFLQDCDLSFMPASEGPEGPSRQKDDNAIWPSSFQGRWFPLHSSQHESEQKSKPDPSFPDSCPHCRLTIECRSCDSSSGQPSSFIAKGPTPRFDGTTTDLKPSEIHCTCGVKLRQRTDGALLLGLALACQDMGHISIRSIKVFLRTLDCPNVKDVSTRNRQKASLAITVYVPEIHVEQTQFSSPDGKSRRRRNLQGPPRKRFISNSSKLLPPATQLLLSILRSDWTFLNDVIQNPGRMAHMEDGNTTLGRSLSFFPSKLALDEVYQRIGGATTSFLDCEESFLPFALSKSNLITCMDLPKDVWQYHIGSFLKARSLDSLRCASKYFHRILQEVVPGLRLRLYTHQVKSLLWMRLRETKIFSERELARHGMAWEDDIHNAATGGATVLLRNRTKGFILQHYAHRISQHNGEEVILRSDDPLSRSVARGGLLCDDPGLGKTITVMSLILQTLGLSTSSVAGSGIDDVIASETEAYKERIFREYWREQSIPQFRSQALNKLLSTFIRNNDDTTIFVFPVRPEEDGVPDYFEVISNPICFQDIRKRINNFSYDLSFPSFQADVIQCFR